MFIVGPVTGGSEALFRFHESGIHRYLSIYLRLKKQDKAGV